MIIDNMPEADYRAADGLNQSALKLLGEEGGPAKFRYGDRAETKALRFGTLIHTAVLQPHMLEENYAVTTLERAGTKLWAEAEAAAAGRILVKQPEYDEARWIADAVRQNRVVRSILEPGPQLKVEQSAFWTDPETEILCKARADGANSEYNVLIDLKSTEDASYEQFRRTTLRYGYHIQAAYYADGYSLAGGFKPDSFVVIAAEKKPPYLTAAYEFRPSDLESAREEIRRLFGIYQRCVLNDDWPGYPDGLQTLSLNRHDTPLELDSE